MVSFWVLETFWVIQYWFPQTQASCSWNLCSLPFNFALQTLLCPVSLTRCKYFLFTFCRAIYFGRCTTWNFHPIGMNILIATGIKRPQSAGTAIYIAEFITRYSRCLDVFLHQEISLHCEEMTFEDELGCESKAVLSGRHKTWNHWCGRSVVELRCQTFIRICLLPSFW